MMCLYSQREKEQEREREGMIKSESVYCVYNETAAMCATCTLPCLASLAKLLLPLLYLDFLWLRLAFVLLLLLPPAPAVVAVNA